MVPNDMACQDASKNMRINLLGSWPDLELTLGHILKLNFQGQKVHVPNRLEEANTMVAFSYLFYRKVINEKLGISIKI